LFNLGSGSCRIRRHCFFQNALKRLPVVGLHVRETLRPGSGRPRRRVRGQSGLAAVCARPSLPLACPAIMLFNGEGPERFRRLDPLLQVGVLAGVVTVAFSLAR
jgi:hypothetical protein